MKETTRRAFVKASLTIGTAFSIDSFFGLNDLFAHTEKNTLNVGYLPITDHLILPVAHARENNYYNNLKIRPILCKSWDEMVAKIDMGVLQAAFLLAPLALHKADAGGGLKCVLFGHLNGSVIAAEKGIKTAADLQGKTIGIPHEYSTHQVLITKYMKDNNADVNDLHLEKAAPSLIVKMMKAGRIRNSVLSNFPPKLIHKK
jgi:NitT/TauT family transport system substrate-binding protein